MEATGEGGQDSRSRSLGQDKVVGKEERHEERKGSREGPFLRMYNSLDINGTEEGERPEGGGPHPWTGRSWRSFRPVI